MIKTILDELNAENGSNYKMEVLKKYQDNELLKRVLKMAYCKVSTTFGSTMKNVEIMEKIEPTMSLEWALDILQDRLVTRETTGNDALDLIALTLSSLNDNDSYVIQKILGRDLRINMGRSNINKVHKNLIVKPVYQRCGVFTFDHKKNDKDVKGTYRKIEYPAILNLKADGTYREVTVEPDGNVSYRSRSGEEYDYPLLTKEFTGLTPGRYFGELTVILDEDNIDDILVATGEKDPQIAKKIHEDFKAGKTVLPRAIGNGMINSDEVPHDSIHMDIWEYVTEVEYQNAVDRIKNTTKYNDMFNQLGETLLGLKRLHIIESIEVKDYKEAIAQVSKWMQAGLEGGVLKNKTMVFRDGTNPEQLKMKLEIDAEMRVTGFYPGKPGTKREKTFGGMTYANDEGTIKGRTSGFSDKQLKEMNDNRDNYIGEVFTLRFNDITRARGSETWALSHPRYIEMRPDKDETDTLEKVQELKLMAMSIEEGE